MKNKIIAIAILASFGIVAFAKGYEMDNRIGGDRDEHGCIPSAGYTWSSSTSQCARPWENASSTASSTRGLENAVLHANENSNVGCVLFAKSMKYGDNDRNGRGDDVRELQEKLREKGYLNASSTGYYGPMTREAVKRYQRDNGISPTGNIFEKTLGQLKKHFCEVRGNGNNNASSSPITNNCKVWYDGCNTCSKSTATGTAACTMMYCAMGGDANWFAAHKPYCKEYFATTTPVVTSTSTATSTATSTN